MTTPASAPSTPSQSWWQLTLKVPQRWADDAGAMLIEGGALGVQTVGGGAEPLPAFACGSASYDGDALPAGQAMLVASYPLSGDGAQIKASARTALESLQLQAAAATMQLVRRDDTGWADRWKQYFKPLKIGRRIWVVPSWESSFAAPTGAVVLHLDPGMAFGTGQHATTALCLRAVERFAERLVPHAQKEANLLDVGCGSGILAIAAAKLGFTQVRAVDIDPDAVAATRDNASRNGVAMQVDATPIAQVGGAYTLIVANILAEPLQEMADDMAVRLRPGGVLVLSGILNTQADAVQRSFEKTGIMVHVERWTHGEWAALGLRRVGKPLVV